jgi:hypothetical protein
MRSGVTMIELAPDAIDVVAQGNSLELATSIGSPVALSGEIIDPKCHGGAMKPGDGKAHKACATLCLRGGIPPVFLASNGQRYLLVDEAGHALRDDRLDEILPFVADDVEIRGMTARQGDVTLMMISPGAVRRL